MNNIYKYNSIEEFCADYNRRIFNGDIRSLDEIINDYKKYFVFSDDDIATAKGYLIFAPWLIQQQFPPELIEDLLRESEELLLNHLDTRDCKEFLCLNLILQARIHNSNNKQLNAINCVHKVIDYSIEIIGYMSDQPTNKPLEKYEIILNNIEKYENGFVIIFIYVGIHYSVALSTINQVLKSDLLEAFRWLLNSYRLFRRLSEIQLDEQGMLTVSILKYEFFQIMILLGGLGFKFEEEGFFDENDQDSKELRKLFEDAENEYAESEEKDDIISDNDIERIKQLADNGTIEEKVKYLMSMLLKISDKDKETISIVNSNLNFQAEHISHDSLLFGCILIINAKLECENGNYLESEKLLLDGFQLLLNNLEDGHIWRSYTELLLGEVCIKLNKIENGIDWIIASLIELSMYPFEIMIGHFIFLSTLFKENNGNASIFFGKLGLSLYIKFVYNLSKENDFFDNLLINDISFDFIRPLIKNGRLGEAFEIMRGMQYLLDNSKKIKSSNPVSFTDRELKLMNKLESFFDKEKIGDSQSFYDEIQRGYKEIFEILKNEDIDPIRSINYQKYLLQDLRKALKNPCTAVLGLFIVNGVVYNITITQDDMFQDELVVDEKELSMKIFYLIENIKNQNKEYKEKFAVDEVLCFSGEIYNSIFSKRTEDYLIKMNVKKIIISSFGIFKFLPFALLYDGKKYLVERYAVSHWSNAGINQTSNPKRPNRIGLLGATFSNKKGISKIKNVNAELDFINNIFKESSNLLDYREEDFNYENIKCIFENSFGLIHIATHFKINFSSIYESLLQLGNGELMKLRSILDWKKPTYPIDFVILSACNTGFPNNVIDQHNTPSEFLHEFGVNSVLATYWPVNDESTALFIEEYYLLLFGEKSIDKDEALRLVQLKFLNKQTPKDFSLPYYWAAFTLSGNHLAFINQTRYI